jgi:hypothetical protein
MVSLFGPFDITFCIFYQFHCRHEKFKVNVKVNNNNAIILSLLTKNIMFIYRKTSQLQRTFLH